MAIDFLTSKVVSESRVTWASILWGRTLCHF